MGRPFLQRGVQRYKQKLKGEELIVEKFCKKRTFLRFISNSYFITYLHSHICQDKTIVIFP